MDTWANHIRAARNARGWSLSEAASHLDSAADLESRRRLWRRWEAGTVTPGPYYATQLRELLGPPSTVDQVNRRQFLTRAGSLVVGGTASSAVSAYVPGADPVDAPLLSSASRDLASQLLTGYLDVAESLASMYRMVDPRAVLSLASTYADGLLGTYDRQAGVRNADLSAVVVGVYCQVGLWACHAHQPAQARRYLAVAREVAAERDDRPLHARTLGALAYLHSSAPRGGQGGNPRRAVELLGRALTLASNADFFTRGWLATWRADQHATLGNLSAARADIELADAALDAGDDGPEHGFFARRHYGYGMRGHLDSVRGLVYALAGELDESERVFTKVLAQAANSRRRIASSGHQALAFTKASQPEAACQALGSSLSLAVAEPYAMGLERVRGVRSQFDPAWADLPCVRDLDQRLTSLAPAGA